MASGKKATAAAMAAVLAAQTPAMAQDKPTESAVPGWDAFVDGIRDLPDRMLAKLPEAQRNDPQIRAEIGRLALEAVTSSAIDTLAGDGDHPTFIPQINQVLNVGQPNADTSYRTARITPGGSYRIRGTRGSMRMVRIAQSAPRPKPGASATPNLGAQRVDGDWNKLKVDKHGMVDVLLSLTRPEGYAGDWWQLQPNTDRLLLRMVGSDWAKEKQPAMSIERVDIPVARPRPSAADLEARLRALPMATSFIALLFVDHVAQLRAGGFVNKLKVFDVSQMGGLAGQFYYEGAYDLKNDEALIVEAKVPAKCLYHSMILTNDIYETTDWYNNHSSLNDAQSRVDKDGVLRIVVSAKDPGVPNWLDTAGYPTGVIQGRWTECDSQPIPSVKKVPAAEVRASLPAETPKVTPEEREKQLRDRRSALQQRPLW